MSAYICNPSHFGILGAQAVLTDSVIYAWKQNDDLITAQRVAQGLAQENIRSVIHRYPGEKQLPGPGLKNTDILEAASIYAAHFMASRQRLTHVQWFKLIMGLDYQCSETDDWNNTPAFQQLEWIRSAIVRSMPAYEDSQWEYSKTLPAIEALYEIR